jgi:glycosyltransferase involved in cell wall biosynthesis
VRLLLISKYPPIQGGVSAECFWFSRTLATLGHAVTVVTNADEVEEDYRVEWNDADRRFGRNLELAGGPRVISTKKDRSHRYIPRANPIVSKLVSLALQECETHPPDFIYAIYLEPYGVAALLLSSLTGIPFVFRHAGSDIGRLMQSPALRKTYQAVLDRANAVVTHLPQQLGISEGKAVAGTTNRLSAKLFYPKAMEPGGVFRFGVFGKVGVNKGTHELLEAVARFARRGDEIELHALWGGTDLANVTAQIERLGIQQQVRVRGFLPHWRVPEFIWQCDVILFLEHEFPIAEHSPLVPMEAIACGRPVLMTQEIAAKPLYRPLANAGCYWTINEPFGVESLEVAMAECIHKAKQLREKVMTWMDSRRWEEQAVWQTATQLDRLAELCRVQRT